MTLFDRTTALTRNTRQLLETTSAHLPQWVTTGAALSIVRAGSKVALGFARRNPAIVLAAGAVGVGAFAYNAYRKHKLSAQPLQVERVDADDHDASAIDASAGRSSAGRSTAGRSTAKRRTPREIAPRTQRKSSTHDAQA